MELKTMKMYSAYLALIILIFLEAFNQVISMSDITPVLSFITLIIFRIGQLSLLVTIVFSVIEKKLKGIKRDIFYVIIFIVVALLYTIYFFPENTVFFSQFSIFYFIRYGLLSYFLIRQLKWDMIILNKFLLFFSIYLGGSLILIKVLDPSSFPYMVFGFAIMLPTLVILYLSFILNKKWIYAISVVFTLFAFLYSHRGIIIVVSALLFLIIYKFFFSKNFTKKKLYILLGCVALSTFALINIDVLLDLLAFVVNGLNLNSRSLDLLIDGYAVTGSGRGWITDFFIDVIRWNPLGLGVFGDRFAFYRVLGEAVYTHNLFLELLVNFGFFVGGILSILIVYYTVTRFIFSKQISKEYFALISIFFCSSIVQLMISSSLYESIPLWIYFGLIFSNQNFEGKSPIEPTKKNKLFLKKIFGKSDGVNSLDS